MFNNLTPVIKNIVILNIGIYVIGHFLLPQDIIINTPMGPEHYSKVTFYGSILSGQLQSEFRPYQIFTSMFIHFGFFHILMNMLALSSIGPILESYLREKRFLALYMAAGLTGSILSYLMGYFGFHHAAISAGASGAVVGVVACVAFIAPNMPVSIMFLPFQFKLKQAFIGFLIFDILGAAYNISGGQTGVGHFAHLGGALAGIILMQFWSSHNQSNRWN